MTDSQDAVRDAWTPQNAAVVTDDHLVLSKLISNLFFLFVELKEVVL
jgi:hypothetical protein